MFQFYAGDLYKVLENVQSRFMASDLVTGFCEAVQTGLKVWKGSSNTFNVAIKFQCKLIVQRTIITTFDIELKLEIEGIPKKSTMDFELKSRE